MRNLDRLVSNRVDRRTLLYSRDTPQIQSAISNTPDIISNNTVKWKTEIVTLDIARCDSFISVSINGK